MALANYEPVEERLAKFWAAHPNGRVFTSLINHIEGEWIFRAEIYREATDGHPAAVGYAQERDGSSNVNKTSACENCETSAIGRALANLGYAPKGARPSREEMQKASRPPTRRSEASGEQERTGAASPPARDPAPVSPIALHNLKARARALQGAGVSIADARAERGLPVLSDCDADELDAWAGMLEALEKAQAS